MLKFLCAKTTTFLLALYSVSTYSQLVGSDIQIWEKANSTLREAGNLRDGNLLNFHYGIKDQLLIKHIKHSKKKSYTLSLIHSSKEDEKIWANEENKISLSNHIYKKKESEKNIKIRKRPSLFSFTGTAEETNGTLDSTTIKLEGRNLYEMIFLPRKATQSDLNKIHSYLSIKYGISLEKGNYYASDGKTIWDLEKQEEFRYRPTGLGRDDGNELYQKQSSNQEDQFLMIGKTDIKKTNIENTSLFDHNNFVIWSDDNKAMKVRPDGTFNILERNWKINFIGSSIPKSDYKIRINKNIINPNSLPVAYWLLLKNTAGDTTRIQGVENEDHIDFSKVDFNTAKQGLISHFTFALGPLKDQKQSHEVNSSSSLINANHFSLDADQITLYPNPVKKGQNFTVLFPPMENLVISIYDGGGRLIKMEKMNQKSTSYSSYLTTQSSYLIILTREGKMVKTFKLTVD